MDFAALNQRIAGAFPQLSPQLQRAARHVLDNPDDVALMSMRRLAANARVHPSTMVRLARAFGFDRYTGFREPFQQRLRVRTKGYLDRARDLQARGADDAASKLIEDILATDVDNLHACIETNDAATLAACADTLARARRLYVVGLRSCFPVAFFFDYVCRMFRGDTVLLDGRGGTFADDLRALGPGDVMLAISVEPYTYETVRAIGYTKRQGGTAVALTDSVVSPLAKDADHVLIVGTDSPSFFHSIVPAMALAEALIGLMVAKGGGAALDTIADAEVQLGEFDAYWHRDPPARGGRRARRR